MTRQYAHRGTVLIITLVIIVLMTMTAAALLFRTTAEVSATAAGRRGQQAWMAAMSGIHRATTVLTAETDTPIDWKDNPGIFQNQLVADDGTTGWYFTIYAPSATDPNAVRYGLIDEAGKININVADADTLANLGLDVERADCLIDWRDSDDEPQPNGAELDYYATLQPIPYRTKNAPVITLGELMLVRGFDASVVYGEDANLNGLLDANEDDGNETFPPDDGDGVLNGGLAAVATATSYEPNTANDGSDRININGDEDELKRLSETSLPRETVEFIVAYRQAGETFQHPVQLLDMEVTVPADAVAEAGGRGGRGPGRGRQNSRGGEDQDVTIRSGVGAEELPEVLDRLTTQPGGSETRLAGLVNVNTASAKVLAATGEISDNTSQQIVDMRNSIDAEQRQTTAWLYTEGIVDADTFRRIVTALTARSFQYRVRCVGFAYPGGQFRVVEAVIDLAGGQPRIMTLRDLTRLGLPVAIDVDELTGAMTP